MPIVLKNHTGNMSILKHKTLPMIKTGEFDFYRCIQFSDNLYGKTVSELHAGNLRLSRSDNRYSNLFPGQKLSYWADSPDTAMAEAKKWGANKNLLTFWAYDDGSSFIPTVYPSLELQIIDGTQIEFNKILKKLEKHENLTKADRELIDNIAYQEPDCLAYESEARKGGTNFLFFEHGFKKLSIREVWLRLGERVSQNHNKIVCATSSDYTPHLSSYGNMFLPIARIGKSSTYTDSDEYHLRMQVVIDKAERLVGEYNDRTSATDK